MLLVRPYKSISIVILVNIIYIQFVCHFMALKGNYVSCPTLVQNPRFTIVLIRMLFPKIKALAMEGRECNFVKKKKKDGRMLELVIVSLTCEDKASNSCMARFKALSPFFKRLRLCKADCSPAA